MKRSVLFLTALVLAMVVLPSSLVTEGSFPSQPFPTPDWTADDSATRGGAVPGPENRGEDHERQEEQEEQEEQKELRFSDFSASTVGEFPEGWQWRKHRDGGEPEEARDEGVDISRWEVQEENGDKYLHIRNEHHPGHTVSVFLDVEDEGWNLHEYPILSWRWRVHEVPPGADERYTETNDSPAAVAVVFGKKMFFIPITIKWVWSSTLPVGAVAYRPGRGRAYNIVLNSGTERLGEWITVERNIFNDYISIFGELPPDEPLAIQLQTDANRTPGGAAEADYDEFKALSSFSEGYPREPYVLKKEYMEGNK
jgi:hypothetical protein